MYRCFITIWPGYVLSAVPGRFVTKRVKASRNFVFDASKVALDSFLVPSLTIEPSSLAALRVAARRKPFFSTCVVQRQYSLVIIPTRSVRKALADPDTRRALADLGVEIAGSSPQEFAAYIASEIPKWTAVVKASGAQLD